MGAYYNWLNQQRLSGAAKSSFIAWFEGHETAIAIGRQCRGDGFQFARGRSESSGMDSIAREGRRPLNVVRVRHSAKALCAGSGVMSRCGIPSSSKPTMNFRTAAERRSGGKKCAWKCHSDG